MITVNQNYFFIVALKEIHKEGLADMKDLATSIRQEIYAEKYGEQMAAKVAEQIKGLTSLEEIAEKLGTYVFMVKNRDNGSFYTEEDAAAFQERKNQYNGQMLTSVMMEDADVVDHRARFFLVYLWV